jgi:uncharacterized Tic20 family protein
MNATLMNTESTRVAGPERSWEVLCHLAPMAGYLIPFGWVLGPLVVWLLKKAEYPSVDLHGREVMNFMISWMIYLLISSVLCLVFIGFILVGILVVGGVVLSIIGAIKASNGELYRYPLTIRLL